MKEQLIKTMQRNQLLNMMYMAKDGQVSKRRIKVIKIVGDSFQAFCFTRQAKRTFMIDSVLAVVPITQRKREVVWLSLNNKSFYTNLAIQSLQRDFSVIENLKMCNVYMTMIEKLLKAITSEHYNIKRDLAKDKIKIVKWEKVSEYFSDLTVTTAGEDQVLRYANQAIKKRVEELLISHINK